MDPVTLVVVPGFVGGLALALLVMRLNQRSHRRGASDLFRVEPLSTDVINMAHIRVAGVGGLGLVGVALVTAVSIPRIGRSLAIGLVMGALLAAILIVRRRRSGPMPSSGRRAGANTMLSIDVPVSSSEEQASDWSAETHYLAAVPPSCSPLASEPQDASV